LAETAPLLEAVGDWGAFLAGGLPERDADALRRHECTGRPLGDGDFLAGLEGLLGRRWRPGKRGRRKQADTMEAGGGG
jgi:putative transposase